DARSVRRGSVLGRPVLLHRAALLVAGVRRAGRGVFFFQAEDGIRDATVTGVQTCALPISQLLEPAGKHRAKQPAEGPGGRAPLRSEERRVGKECRTRRWRCRRRKKESAPGRGASAGGRETRRSERATPRSASRTKERSRRP